MIIPLQQFGFLFEYPYLSTLKLKSNHSIMRTIKFSEEEISFLHKVYLEKLVQTEKDLQRIKDFLKKLEVSTLNKPVEEEPITLKRPLKPKVKDLEPKILKKRGRKPKAVIVPDESVPETIVNEPKKRGRKPKAKVVEPKVPKKRGRPKNIPSDGNTPLIITNEPKKRGRKPKAVSVPKGEPKKRGRKPKVSNESTPEPEPVSTNKEGKKIVKKRSPYRKNRKWRGLRLAPLSKPLKLKEPKEEPVEETIPVVEPVVPPAQETIIPPTEEPKE